jgi:hypothetical protein
MRRIMSKIAHRPYRRPRAPSKKPSPEITPPRIVTAYSPQRVARNRLYERTVAARSGTEPEAPQQRAKPKRRL